MFFTRRSFLDGFGVLPVLGGWGGLATKTLRREGLFFLGFSGLP
jgi:hypothetical protein